MALITSACPVCGVPGRSCGGPSAHVPIDDPFYLPRQENAIMQEPEQLAEYEYEVYGNTVQGQLNQADAERLGARPVGESASAPADESPADGDQAAPQGKARKSVANK